MDVFPRAHVERFEQLKSGTLFLAEIAGHKMAALKAFDEQREGEQLMVLLGPAFPSHVRPGQLVSWERLTVFSFAGDYTLELPVEPGAWSSEAPPPNSLAMVQTPNEVFVRTYFHDVRGEELWVAMENGAVSKPNFEMVMYATSWSLSVRNKHGERFPIIELGT